ncbi:MAG: PQQ-binding-like beta-propeller repeat protein [Promethearchaeota archaeon]
MRKIKTLSQKGKRAVLFLLLCINLIIFTPKINAFPYIPTPPPIIPLSFCLWNFTAESDLSYSPALVEITGDDIMDIIVSSDDYLYAIDGASGEQLWNYSADVTTVPSIGDLDNDGKPEVVFGDFLANVTALNAEDGSWLWDFPLADVGFITQRVYAPPVIGDVDADGKMEVVIGSASVSVPFIGAADNYFHAINGEDGSLLWEIYKGAHANSSIYSGVTLGDIDFDNKLEVIIGAGIVDSTVIAFNGDDGSLIWSYEADSAIYGSPILCNVDEEPKLEVIVVTLAGSIYVLDSGDGTLLWRKNFGGSIWDSPSIGDLDSDSKLEIILTISNLNKMISINAEDGSVNWGYEADGELSSASIADIDNDGSLDVLIASRDGKVHAVFGSNGSRVWTYSTQLGINGVPVVADLNNDRDLEIIVGSYDNKLYALNMFSSGSRVYWQGESGDNSFTRVQNQYYTDNDGDLLSDYSEDLYGSNKSISDTDGDKLTDGLEASLNLNPIKNDTDEDDLTDYLEIYSYLTNPRSNDTDRDKMLDGWEIKYGLDPLVGDSSEDLDNDGLQNFDEFTLGTLPAVPDSDADGLSDGQEVHIYDTNPLLWDTDGDGLSDGYEVNMGYNPASSGPSHEETTTQQQTSPAIDHFLVVCILTIVVCFSRKKKEP